MISYNFYTYYCQIQSKILYLIIINFPFLNTNKTNSNIYCTNKMEGELTGEQYEHVLKYMEATSE